MSVEQELRLRCVDLAMRGDPANVVHTARAIYAFVTGESDKTPREKVNAALDEANVS